MKPSSNDNIFRVTGTLCGKTTGYRWFTLTKSQERGALIFSLICASTNAWVNNQDTGYLRCHRAHYDVTVMFYLQLTENEHSALINCLPNVPGISCSLIMYLSDVDECITSPPCLHGGTCNNTAGSYECFCTPQWNGTNCDEGIYLFIFWGVNYGYACFTSRQLSVFSKRKIIMLVTGK